MIREYGTQRWGRPLFVPDAVSAAEGSATAASAPSARSAPSAFAEPAIDSAAADLGTGPSTLVP